MKHFDEIPSLRLQPNSRKVFIPFDLNNKRKGSAILLLSPNEETSYKMMNLPYIYNPQYFISYYMDRNVNNYIDSVEEITEAMMHNIEEPDTDLFQFLDDTINISFDYIGGTQLDKRLISTVYNNDVFSKWCKSFKLKDPDKKINVIIHSSLEDLEGYLKENNVEDYKKHIIFSYTDGNSIHILSNVVYQKNVMDGPYNTYLLNELICYIIQKKNPRVNKYARNYIAIACSGQYEYFSTNREFLDNNDAYTIRMVTPFYRAIQKKDYKAICDMVDNNSINPMKKYITRDIYDKTVGLFEAKLSSKEKKELDVSSSLDESTLLETTLKYKYFHISKTNLDGKTLTPRIPDNFLIKYGYEDGETPRVCFSESIDGSLAGLSRNISNKEFYVHVPKNKIKTYKPTIEQVPDCKITKELWVEESVELKCIGKIKVADAKDKEYKYSYGKNEASLYYWNWEWIEKYNESTLLESKEPEPTQIGFYHGEGAHRRWNSLIEENDKKYRERVECLIIRDDTVYLCKKDNGEYRLPGGSTEPDKSCKDQCVAECQEEAHITPKNLKYILSYYLTSKKPKSYTDIKYDGYYTHLYIGEFARKYTGYVADEDKDQNMIKNGDWYNISEVYNELYPEHKKAIDQYMKNESTLLESNDKMLYNSSEDVQKIINKIPKSEREDIDGNEGEDLIVYRKTINDSAFIEVYRSKENPEEAAIVIGAAPDARGKGYTDSLIKDASRECIKLGITRLCWKCDFNNKHSYNLALRNGFVDKTENHYMMYWLEKELNSINESTSLLENSNEYKKYSKDVHKVLDTLSEEESDHVGGGYWVDSNRVIYRKVEYDNSEPIGFIDVYLLPKFKRIGLIVFAVTDKARGKGIGKKLIRSAINELKNNKDIDGLRWLADNDNEVSIHMAESLGFKYQGDTNDNCKEYFYEFSKNITEAINTDQKKIKKYLYKERIRTNNQALESLRKAKTFNPQIKKVFLKLDQYKELNLFIDMSYYHELFLKNNTMKLDRGVQLYFKFLNQMINNKEYDIYKKKTIFIPLFQDTWGPYTPDIYDYRVRLNPLSVIMRLLRKEPEKLQQEWGDKLIIFVGDNGYFRVDFNTLTFNRFSKFKKNCDKLLSNTKITENDINDEDDAEIVDDNKDSKKAIVTDIVDRIEKNTNIRIDNLISGSDTQKNIENSDHLRIRDIEYQINDSEDSVLIAVLSPNNKDFEDTIDHTVIKNAYKINCIVKK